MSEMGMQMPGRRRPRASSPNVYTGLMLGAVACLVLAVVFVVMAGMKIGPADKGAMAPFSIHEEGKVKLAE